MGVPHDFPLCFHGNGWKRIVPIDVGKLKQQKDLAQRLLPFDEENVPPVPEEFPIMSELSHRAEPITLGTLLREARERRELPVEQVARDTRIRASRLREIENDDFSQFSHSSYVRMFLMDYSRYLGLPESEIRPLLPERGEFGAEGYQYLQELPQNEVAYVAPRRQPSRGRFLPSLAAAAALVVTGLIGFQAWSMVRNIDRIGLGRTAEPTPVVEPETEPSEVVPPVTLETPAPEFFENFQLSEDLLPEQAPAISEKATVVALDVVTPPADMTAEDSKFLFVGGDLENNTSLR